MEVEQVAKKKKEEPVPPSTVYSSNPRLQALLSTGSTAPLTGEEKKKQNKQKEIDTYQKNLLATPGAQDAVDSSGEGSKPSDSNFQRILDLLSRPTYAGASATSQAAIDTRQAPSATERNPNGNSFDNAVEDVMNALPRVGAGVVNAATAYPKAILEELHVPQVVDWINPWHKDNPNTNYHKNIDIANQFYQGLSGKSKKTYSDVLMEQGATASVPTAFVGVGLDIGLDPTTYINPFKLGGVTKGGEVLKDVSEVKSAEQAARTFTEEAAIKAERAKVAKTAYETGTYKVADPHSMKLLIQSENAARGAEEAVAAHQVLKDSDVVLNASQEAANAQRLAQEATDKAQRIALTRTATNATKAAEQLALEHGAKVAEAEQVAQRAVGAAANAETRAQMAREFNQFSQADNAKHLVTKLTQDSNTAARQAAEAQVQRTRGISFLGQQVGPQSTKLASLATGAKIGVLGTKDSAGLYYNTRGELHWLQKNFSRNLLLGPETNEAIRGVESAAQGKFVDQVRDVDKLFRNGLDADERAIISKALASGTNLGDVPIKGGGILMSSTGGSKVFVHTLEEMKNVAGKVLNQVGEEAQRAGIYDKLKENYLPKSFAKKLSAEEKVASKGLDPIAADTLLGNGKINFDIADILEQRLAKHAGQMGQQDVYKTIRDLGGRTVKSASEAKALKDLGYKETSKLAINSPDTRNLIEKAFQGGEKAGVTLLHPDAVRTLENYANVFHNVENAGEFTKSMQKAVKSWKAMVTIANPGYWVKQSMSDGLANFVAGVHTAEPYAKATKLLKGTREASLARLLGEHTLTGQTMTLGGEVADLRSIRNAVRYSAGTEGAEIGTELSKRGLSKEAGALASSLPGRAAGAVQDSLSTGVHNLAETREEWFRTANIIDYVDKNGRDVTLFHPNGELTKDGNRVFQEAGNRTRKFNIDYGNLTPYEKQLRSLIPFYCVPTDHKIWTRRGWLAYDEVVVGEDVMTFHPKTYEMQWEPLLEIASFEYEGELRELRRRTGVIKFTPNHRWPYENLNGYRNIDEAKNLQIETRIPTRGEYTEEGSILSPRRAAILGWIVTDGHGRWRGNHYEAVIYQHPKKFLEEICKLTGSLPRNPHPVVAVPVQLDDRNVITRYYKTNADLKTIIPRLSREAAESMWDAMFQAGGNIGNASLHFAQQKPDVLEAFQMLCYMTGRCGWYNKGASNGRGMYVNKQPFIGWKRQCTNRSYYKGKVWCPRTKTGTWFVNNNGAVMPTGNTWTRRNLPLQFELLFTKPGMQALYPKVINGFNEALGTEGTEETLIPEWIRELPGIKLATTGRPQEGTFGKLLSGLGAQEQARLDISSLTPIGDLSTLSSLDSWKGAATEISGRITPLLKAPFELATGNSAGTEIPTGAGSNPLKWASYQTPVGRLLTKGNTETADWAKWGFGIPLRSIEQPQEYSEMKRRSAILADYTARLRTQLSVDQQKASVQKQNKIIRTPTSSGGNPLLDRLNQKYGG